MARGGDTTKLEWSESEKRMAMRGEIPPGRTRIQYYQMRHKLKKTRGWKSTAPSRMKGAEWKPSEDLAVLRGEVCEGRTQEYCERRARWLKVNYIDVGWGSLIGTRPIVDL